MFLRNYIKKYLGLDEAETSNSRWAAIKKLEQEVSHWRGQANVDATENLFLQGKLRQIRTVLGKDDECFSKFTRDQIEAMSIEAFRQVEAEIDQDTIDGKRFLQ